MRKLCTLWPLLLAALAAATLATSALATSALATSALATAALATASDAGIASALGSCPFQRQASRKQLPLS